MELPTIHDSDNIVLRRAILDAVAANVTVLTILIDGIPRQYPVILFLTYMGFFSVNCYQLGVQSNHH